MTAEQKVDQRDWLAALGLAAVGLIFRLWHLAAIKVFIFD
jgi:hypothetical protein